MLKVIFDFYPAPIFLVDADLTILDFNAAAGRRFDIASGAILQQRLGEARHCYHLRDAGPGCGHSPACWPCGLRHAVRATFRGKPVVRDRQQLAVVHVGQCAEVETLVTTALFPHPQAAAVLVLLEEINELVDRRNPPLDNWDQYASPRPAAVTVMEPRPPTCRYRVTSHSPATSVASASTPDRPDHSSANAISVSLRRLVARFHQRDTDRYRV